MASIKQRRDGTWRVQVEKNGYRASKTFSSRTEAQHWGVRKELEFAGMAGEDKGKTFSAAVDLYLKTVSIRKKDAVDWERRRFEQFVEFFGDTTQLSKITPARIGQWRDHMLETVTPATVNRYKNLLSNLFKVAAEEWQWISQHPFRGVRFPSQSAARDKVWGWREIRRVLRFCQQSPGAKTQAMGRAFHIALRTGLRLKEVLHAKMVNNVIVLTDTKTTHAGVKVRVPTTHAGRRVMSKYAKYEWPQMSANEASTIFSQACVLCGIRRAGQDGPTFHDARATALTHMSRRMDVMTLQKISRHRDVNILTNTYYRETAEQISARL